MPPQNLKRGKLPTPLNLPPSGTQKPGAPSANEGGKKPGVEGVVPPPRGQWGMCPHKTLKGEAANLFKPATEWDSKTWRSLSKRGWGKTVGGGGQATSQGQWGMCPHKTLKGKLPTFLTLPPSGTQNPGKPSANEGGEKTAGWRGPSPLPGGFGGCAPKTKKQGISCQLLPTRHRVGLKTLANSQQTRVGKTGGGGGCAPSQGAWGMCPQNKIKG